MTDKPSRWANLRDICSAVREMVIVIAMLVLLIAPSFVKDSLERAGIRSVAGVEFDMDNLAQSRDELDAALAQIDTLRNQLTTAQQQVQGLAESSPMLAPSSLATSAGLSPATSLAMPSELASPTVRSVGPTMRVAPSPSLASVSRLLASMKDQAEETDRSLRRSKVHADQVLEQASRKMQLTPPQELFGRTELFDHTGAKPNDASESSIESSLTR